MRVRIGDLDLTRDSGAQIALGRIDIAARRFCTVPGQYNLDPAYARCRANLVARAVAKLDAPRVTALNRASRSLAIATK